MDFEFKIEGLRELEEYMTTLGPTTARRVGGFAVKKAADVIVQRAKELAPVRKSPRPDDPPPGGLRDSITSVAAKGESDEVLRHIGWARPVGRRAHLSEFGTRHSAPQPHMRPALDEKAAEAFGVMGEELGRAIERDAARAVKRTSG